MYHSIFCVSSLIRMNQTLSDLLLYNHAKADHPFLDSGCKFFAFFGRHRVDCVAQWEIGVKGLSQEQNRRITNSRIEARDIYCATKLKQTKLRQYKDLKQTE